MSTLRCQINVPFPPCLFTWRCFNISLFFLF